MKFKNQGFKNRNCSFTLYEDHKAVYIIVQGEIRRFSEDWTHVMLL